MHFEYLPDLSSFGRNTQTRPDMPLSRDCLISNTFCPGAMVPNSVLNQGEVNVSANPSITATTNIPGNITDMFTSATMNSTIASILDIQHRSWVSSVSEYFDDHKPYPKGVYQQLDTLISRGTFVLVEGLVADMVSGGIGFRNHSAPSGLEYGGQWDEDILWVEPEFSCTNTNLSFETTLGNIYRPDTPPFQKVQVVDEGGFAALRHGSPIDDWPNITYSAPNVKLRADQSAWFNNYLAAYIFNLTDGKSPRYGLNVTLGTRYPLALDGSASQNIFPLGVNTALLEGKQWLSYPETFIDSNGNLTMNGQVLYPPENYTYEIAAQLFDQLGDWCSGAENNESSGIDHNVECGYVFGAPSRVGGGSALEKETGSRWRIPFYVCAGAVKATVKTVTYAVNGSAIVDSLTIHEVRDKAYNGPLDYPLWAVEDRWYPGSEGAFNAPLWGIVDGSYEGTKGYNFTRAPTIYLPYTNYLWTWDSMMGDGPLDILAGPVAPYAVLNQVLQSAFGSGASLLDNLAQYGGRGNVALMSMWNSLSNTTEGVELILSLVWTDIMASASLGTNLRGSNPASGQSTHNTSSIGGVTVYKRTISYDIRYAIPAILLLAAWIILWLVGFAIGLMRRHGISHLKQLLNDTSVGRVAAGSADPNARAFLRSSTTEWLKEVGSMKLGLGEKLQDYELQNISQTAEADGEQLLPQDE